MSSSRHLHAAFHQQIRALCAFACLGFASCDDHPDPPPPDDAPPANAQPLIKPIEFDPKRSILVKADRTITIANLLFVVQSMPQDPGSIAVTLTTSRPSPDGSRLTFGAIEHVPSADGLLEKPIRFGGGSQLDPTGDGVFTPLGVYQPKFASIKITAVDKQDVRGTLSGEFYRFNTAAPTARPKVINLTADFVAARIDR